MAKGKSIDEFKYGEVVTRVEPIYIGTKDNLRKDTSYMGKPFVLKSTWMNFFVLGSVNENLGLFGEKDREIVLEDNIWNNGWDYYLPEGSAINDLIKNFTEREFLN